MISKIKYSAPVRLLLKLKAQPTGSTVFEFPPIRKAHYMSLLLGASILAVNFYSGILCTKIRGKTFGKNLAVIQDKYGESHKKAFGDDTKINKYGYPDMGNNLYS